ncbi:MAG: DUF4825 domain-containing protein [Clostridia bacterium]|nr:DUF4825 domain-containing protein [Clostridia bacterium]
MTDNKLDCEIVQDLLPSYIDGVTSEKTTAAVSEHLEGCENCTAVYENMKDDNASEPQQIREVNFLKKTKKKALAITLIGIAAAFALAIVLLFVRFCVVSRDVSNSVIVLSSKISNEKNLDIELCATDSATAISDIQFEEKDGVVYVTAKGTLSSFLNSSGTRRESYTASEKIKQIRVGNDIIWDNGIKISAMVSDLYNAKHEYIGDMPANSNLLNRLDVAYTLGSYTSELKTAKEPYEWIINLEETFNPGNDEYIEKVTKAYSCALIATIDNLDTVTFVYNVKGEGQQRISVTAEDATALVGRDIKSCAKTPAALQALVGRLEIENLSSTRPASLVEYDTRRDNADPIEIKIMSGTKDDLYAINYSFYVDGRLISGGGGCNADNSAIKTGQVFYLSLTPGMDFPEDADKVEIEISVEDKAHKSYDVTPTIVISTSDYSSPTYVISGDSKSGYTIAKAN